MACRAYDVFPTDYSIPPQDLAVEGGGREVTSLCGLPEHSHIPTSRKIAVAPAALSYRKYYYESYDPFLSLAAAAAGDENNQACDGDLSCRRASSNSHRPREGYRPSTGFPRAGSFSAFGRGLETRKRWPITATAFATRFKFDA